MTGKLESGFLTNAEIADRLEAMAQLLAAKGENPYKVRAYRRAAGVIRGLGESVDEIVRSDGDLTEYVGIGKAISGAVREIVLEGGKLRSLEKLRAEVSPEVVAISQFPRLDAKRVLRIYKKLGISTIDELRDALEQGRIEGAFGARMAQHVRQGLIDSRAILLYHAHALVAVIKEFLTKKCGVARAVAAGDYRRWVETIDELVFVVEAREFRKTVEAFEGFGGRTPLVEVSGESATFALAAGPMLRLEGARKQNWGVALIRHTGSKAHLAKLKRAIGADTLEQSGRFASEEALYERYKMEFIPPELREGLDEVRRARAGTLPVLITHEEIRGDLHMHTMASDGVDTIEEMAATAQERAYEYIGISDHSQSLKIANGLSVERLREQIRAIDKLNGKLKGIRVLKSAEVDILADGKLDYPDEMLKQLDYTVCSIHSRFAMGKEAQTERILRAMDNRYFNILGHATGRLLLKRPGYEIDVERVIEHAKQNGCFLELNCSPDRLDVSAENARLAREAEVAIAISTDSHSTGELGTIRYGLEQARRAGLERSSVLNCRGLNEVLKAFAR